MAKKISHKDIPIVINNRNRYTFLRQLVDSLRKRGYTNIIILDNASTYPPLLEYYKTTDCEVIHLGKNLGYMALEQIPLYQTIKKNYFVYTDSDVVPVEACPDDFLKFFVESLEQHKTHQKVGLSLKIDDLPDSFSGKKQVIAWETKYYSKPVTDKLFEAPVDTTFALHRPYAKISIRGRFKMFRAAYPYAALHLPWYNDSGNLSEEEQFYIDHVEIGTHWSKGIPLESAPNWKRVLHYIKADILGFKK